MDVNGLPIGVLVVLIGLAVVVASWLALRFGRKIALFLAGAGIVLAVVLGMLALAGQSAANFQTAKAATEAARAAKASSVGLSVGAVVAALCLGGMGTATVGALGVAGVAWWRLQLEQRTEKRLPRQPQTQPQALPEPQTSPVVWVVGDGQQSGIDLSGVDFSQWGW